MAGNIAKSKFAQHLSDFANILQKDISLDNGKTWTKLDQAKKEYLPIFYFYPMQKSVKTSAKIGKNMLPSKNDTVAIKQDKLFFAEIAAILHKARATAYKAVNTVMIQTNWQIGKRIVEQEQNGKIRADYGDYLIVNLSRYLTDVIGKGFSEANLRNFRQFYLSFPNGLQFARRRLANLEKLSWSHWCAIMRIENEGDNPTLGIILCAEKDETVVKYSVLNESKQIFASKYKTILPTEKQLAAMIGKKNANLFLSHKLP